MATFRLPDLGEGLTEAEILAWHVKPGDVVKADQPMVSVETAKAVVDVPVPYDGTVAAVHGAVGDIIATGAPLVEFDAGTVVGRMPSPREEIGLEPVPRADSSRAHAPTRSRALPLARGVARHLGIDLEGLRGSGPGGAIVLEDVLAARGGSPTPTSSAIPPSGTALDALPAGARAEPLRGARRAMAQSMTRAHTEVPASTVCDDADIDAWSRRDEYTLRLLRALACGCRAEPALNAWYDAGRQLRVLLDHIDVALAIDVPEGLIVPVVRHVERAGTEALRAEVARLKQAALEHRLTLDDLRGPTVMLSNFGTLAGRYATPLLVPPVVAILGAGRVREEPVLIAGTLAAHRRMPLSLTFDHRCVTGGEACRFLAAVITDLERRE